MRIAADWSGNIEADRTPKNHKRKHGVESAGPLSQNGGPANSLFVLQKHSVSFTQNDVT